MADAFLKFEYPAEKRDIIIAAFARQFGYQETINDKPNPQSPGEFATQQILMWIANVVERDQIQQGTSAVQAKAETDAKALALTTLASVKVSTDQG